MELEKATKLPDDVTEEVLRLKDLIVQLQSQIDDYAKENSDLKAIKRKLLAEIVMMSDAAEASPPAGVGTATKKSKSEVKKQKKEDVFSTSSILGS